MANTLARGHRPGKAADQRARSGPAIAAPLTPDHALKAFVACLAERRALLILTLLVSLVVACSYLKFAPAQYSSSALVLIDQKSNAPLRFSTTLSDAATESANIESQVEVIKSERTLQLVVQDQGLINDPALKPNPFVSKLNALIRRAAFWMRSGSQVEFKERTLVAAAIALRQFVSVRRLGTTFLIEVSATMPDPTQAAAVTNSIAQTYIADQQQRRQELALRQSKLLQARSDELERHARDAEEAVEQLKYSGSFNGENSAAAQVRLKDLQSLAQTYRVLHDKFLEQSAASWQQQFLSIPDATVASQAYPPLEKSAPRSSLVLACALLVGMSLGAALILVLDRKKLGLSS